MKSVFSLGSFLGHELISSAWELNSGDTLPGPCVQVYLDVVLEPSPLSLITPPPPISLLSTSTCWFWYFQGP